MKSSLENLSKSSFKKFDNSDLWPTRKPSIDKTLLVFLCFWFWSEICLKSRNNLKYNI